MESRGRLKGNKAGYRVLDKSGEPLSEGRFTWKKIYDDFANDKATYKAFIQVSLEELNTLIAKAPVVAGEIKVFNIEDIANGFNENKSE